MDCTQFESVTVRKEALVDAGTFFMHEGLLFITAASAEKVISKNSKSHGGFFDKFGIDVYKFASIKTGRGGRDMTNAVLASDFFALIDKRNKENEKRNASAKEQLALDISESMKVVHGDEAKAAFLAELAEFYRNRNERGGSDA